LGQITTSVLQEEYMQKKILLAFLLSLASWQEPVRYKYSASE